MACNEEVQDSSELGSVGNGKPQCVLRTITITNETVEALGHRPNKEGRAQGGFMIVSFGIAAPTRTGWFTNHPEFTSLDEHRAHREHHRDHLGDGITRRLRRTAEQV